MLDTELVGKVSKFPTTRAILLPFVRSSKLTLLLIDRHAPAHAAQVERNAGGDFGIRLRPILLTSLCARWADRFL
jgi:hypothetical protein